MARRGQRRTNYAQRTPEGIKRLKRVNNPRINAISRLAYLMVGGKREFYLLPKERRKKLRHTAAQMQALGVNFSLAEKAEEIVRNGFVYIISHPRMDGVKIGRAYDPEARTNAYQTGCPYRQYKLEYAVYFEDCYQAEKDIHNFLKDSRLQGEWFAVPRHVAEDLIDNFKEGEQCGNP